MISTITLEAKEYENMTTFPRERKMRPANIVLKIVTIQIYGY